MATMWIKADDPTRKRRRSVASCAGTPYRDNNRPELMKGDRIRIVMTLWERIFSDSGFSSWTGHEAEVRQVFTREDEGSTILAPGEQVAVLDLDHGGGIWMPVRFLERL